MRASVIVVGLVIGSGMPRAQAPAEPWKGTVTLSGTIVDEAGKPLAGVTVQLVFATTKTGPQVTTNARGEWKVEHLAEGLWLVQVSKKGFDPQQLPVGVFAKAKDSPISRITT